MRRARPFSFRSPRRAIVPAEPSRWGARKRPTARKPLSTRLTLPIGARFTEPLTSNSMLGLPPETTEIDHATFLQRIHPADRERYYGDPRFVDVPLQTLLSASYAESRRALIRPDRAWPGLPPAGVEATDVNRHGGHHHRGGHLGQPPAQILRQKPRYRGDPSGSAKHLSRDAANQGTSFEEPDIRPMAGDEKRSGCAADEPSGRNPPVGVDDVGRKSPQLASDGVVEGQEKPGKAEGCPGRSQGPLMQASGVRHPFQGRRPVAEPVYRHIPNHLVPAQPWRVRREDTDLMAESGHPLGDPGHECAGRVAGKAGVVVGDCQNAQPSIARGHRDTSPRIPEQRGR